MAFAENTPATLLIGSNGPRKGLRVRADNLLKEFVDDDLIGRGPSGLLYFNDIKDFAGTSHHEKVRHTYKVVVSKKGGHDIVTVEFFNSLKFGTPYAKFEGTDKDHLVAQNEMNDYGFQGQWVDFEIIAQSAKVTGGPGERTALSFAGAQATWHDKENEFTEKFNVSGDLFYKDIPTLMKAQRVSYNQGGVVFYQRDGVNPNHIAYFVPDLENLPGQASLSDGIAWKKEP